MAINVSLSDIAKYAYGSGFFEGKSGGAGNIGLMDGKVVKFNTHRDDRGGAVTQEMKHSCDALRLQMYELVKSAYKGVDGEKTTAQLSTIRQQLGIAVDGQIVSKKLLDRTTVATIVNQLEKNTGRTIWNFKPGEAASLSSSGKDTRFSTFLNTAVKDRLEGTVNNNAKHIADIVKIFADTLKGVKRIEMNDAARQLMVGVVRSSAADAMGHSAGFYFGTGGELNLKYAGSVLDLLKNVNLSSTEPLVLARSLPADKARAFLKACTFFGDISLVSGLGTRLHAAAGELAQLKNDQFTLANVIRLAYPGEEQLEKDVAKLCNGEAKVSDKKMGDLLPLVVKTVEKNSTEDSKTMDEQAAHERNERKIQLLDAGFKPSDIRQIMEKTDGFKPSMIPPAFFVRFGIQNTNAAKDDAMTLLLKDITRSKIGFQITALNGDNFESPEPSGNDDVEKLDAKKFDTEGFNKILDNLCGENKAMRDNICFFMTQTAKKAESALGAALGRKMEQFFTKANFSFCGNRDGSVAVIRTGKEDSHVPYYLSLVFLPDGGIKFSSAKVAGAEVPVPEDLVAEK